MKSVAIQKFGSGFLVPKSEKKWRKYEKRILKSYFSQAPWNPKMFTDGWKVFCQGVFYKHNQTKVTAIMILGFGSFYVPKSKKREKKDEKPESNPYFSPTPMKLKNAT